MPTPPVRRIRAYPVPQGRSARRLGWQHLPPPVRRAIEARLGGPVADATSCGGGFTPGFASVLTRADGARLFVKAASLVAQRPFAESYREEARKLGALPGDVAAPRLRWYLEEADWVVLGIEHVEARQPHRPWRDDDLLACLDAVVANTAALTPPPPGMKLADFHEELADWPDHWSPLLGREDLPHAAQAHELAQGFATVTAGDSLVHCDLRDDNLLIAPDGRVFACDWNWPVRGAAWLDPLLLLIGPRGDGLDVERVLAEHPAFAGVPSEHVDVVLALVAGYFLHSADHPVPPTSPFVREHQRWEGEVCYDWLAQRRGWS